MADVEIRVEGKVGRITLNRPEALNALNDKMMYPIDDALKRWAGDAAVAMVIIDAVGDRAFCAGGDITEFYRRTRAGDLAYGRTFWRDEYRLNARIANYPKPYIALMDGIVMGGGVGLSAHGSHRIVTERSMIAMPECAIGLIPDVGGTFLLGHAPGRLGEYLGLTGARMGAADAILAGFADFFVSSGKLPDLIAALVEEADPRLEEADLRPIERFAETPPEGSLASALPMIGDVFAGAEMSDIRTALELAAATDWGGRAIQALDKGCPLSLHAALLMIRAARVMDSLEEALQMEYRYTWRSLEQGDFMEGIRAAVIDKDRTPRWAKPDIDDVGRADVDAMLRGLDENELTF